MKPKEDTPTVNFEKFSETIKKRSSDSLINYDFKAMFDGPSKFISSKTSVPVKDRVAFTSVPHSGVPLLRNYLEKITGVVTGSDSPVSCLLNLAKQQSGLKGEEIINDSVWLTETNYPLAKEDA